MQRHDSRHAPTLLSDQRGLTTVEYAIVLCLIAMAAVATWDSFGEVVVKHVGDSTTTLDNTLKGGE